MLIESEDLKEWLDPIIRKYTIHFSCGDYIMREGQPYFDLYKQIERCEKKMNDNDIKRR